MAGIIQGIRARNGFHEFWSSNQSVSLLSFCTRASQWLLPLHSSTLKSVTGSRCPWTRRFDRVLEDAAAEWYPHIKFVRVDCPKYPGFCIARQRKDYPFVEIFHSPKPAHTQEGVKDRSISRYSVNVTPYNYDMSAYGFREFFKRHQTAFQPPADK
nr:uncharacterized protein LOC112274824 isoform X2 [Physcomitrium patens]|eukprot:XP_024360379.1 uncharacterized protein LOC112274824 isoform X2 [Physcomitrella patens]